MTQVDFYISKKEQSRETLACRIVEKAYSRGNTVFIQTSDANQAERMDKLLWTFRQGSFLPHERQNQQNKDESVPILIGWEQEPGNTPQVLVNLSHEIPSWFSRINRVMEVVDGNPQTKLQARERYQFYRDRGYPLETHNIG